MRARAREQVTNSLLLSSSLSSNILLGNTLGILIILDSEEPVKNPNYSLLGST